MKLLFSVEINNNSLYNDLCIKAVINLEDKCPLNLDKFHLWVKVFLSCPSYLTTSQLTWIKLLSINIVWFHILKLHSLVFH